MGQEEVTREEAEYVGLDEVDREMINRYNAVEDGMLTGTITNIQKDTRRGNEYIILSVETPVGDKGYKFPMPERPTKEDKIVRLCTMNDVDPKYPSSLEGHTVKITEDGEIYIPEPYREKIKIEFKEILIDPDTLYYTKMAFFSIFLPITLTTYYMVLHRAERRTMREDRVDYIASLTIWALAMIFCLLTIGSLF